MLSQPSAGFRCLRSVTSALCLLNARQIMLSKSSHHDNIYWRFFDLAMGIGWLMDPSLSCETVHSRDSKQLMHRISLADGIEK